MKYLTVGTKNINFDLFRDVQDTNERNSMKPAGGLWLTEYNEDIQNYNHWVDFMVGHPYILFYKNKSGSPWRQDCSVVTLKENSNLFYLDSKEKLEYLVSRYPFQDGKFSYPELSRDYDGVYVDLGNLFHASTDYDIFKKFSSFGVSSLILFHLGCIDFYYPGEVLIEPFDYENNMNFDRFYEIKYDKNKKKVLKR